MTTPNPEKTAYHHGDLRQQFIDVAVHHLRDCPTDEISLRALAREIGVSPTAAYRHFASKNALFAAIAEQGFEELRQTLLRANERYPDDFEQEFIELGMIYVQWAVDNPERYQLLFDSPLLDFAEYPTLRKAGTRSYQVLLDTIERGIKAKLLVNEELPLLGGTVWASTHGLARLLHKNLQHTAPRDDSDIPGATIMALGQNTRRAIGMFYFGICKR